MPVSITSPIWGLLCLALLSASDRSEAAQDFRTDANLITAIDVSASIEPRDERLQFRGMAEALLDPRFLQAVERGRHGRIGFTAFTWSYDEHVMVVPWTLIDSRADAEEIAERLRAARGMTITGHAARPWQTDQPTDISAALERAIEAAMAAPFVTRHQVINICGDGVDNLWVGPGPASARAEAMGMMVNGLVLGNNEGTEDVADYYRRHVQAGPGSFVLIARSFEDIASAMLAKFIMELAAVSSRSGRASL